MDLNFSHQEARLPLVHKTMYSLSCNESLVPYLCMSNYFGFIRSLQKCVEEENPYPKTMKNSYCFISLSSCLSYFLHKPPLNHSHCAFLFCDIFKC